MNNLFFGTWELDGIQKNINEEQAMELIKHAKEKGIKKFDTALAYGNGKVEKILSKVIDKDDIILTKVPAIIKPEIDSIDSVTYYPPGYTSEKVLQSKENLSRDIIDIILLHNWSKLWSDDEPCLNELINQKEKGNVRYIGISLPNYYNERLSEKIVQKIDYLEAPLNTKNDWILRDLDFYKTNNVKVILRSLFLQGKSIKNGELEVKKTLKETSKHETYLAVGMTSKNQIDENVETLKGVVM